MEIVPFYVGLDYHSDTIRVCVMDADGETMINKNVANDPGPSATWCRSVAALFAVWRLRRVAVRRTSPRN